MFTTFTVQEVANIFLFSNMVAVPIAIIIIIAFIIKNTIKNNKIDKDRIRKNK